ncbi:unnamed protein product [Nyctereutes procyonoides]|uniref:(raccoon dog) hypothetical protein n=1 Tax=Nyctereutes procyonoides TaxID=34880 RepID=A0A811ZLT4_NYCPR|nr:unnamed protein product [Nyctereutes procyonoides]
MQMPELKSELKTYNSKASVSSWRHVSLLHPKPILRPVSCREAPLPATLPGTAPWVKLGVLG